MQLSKRLKAVADSVTTGNRVADVGCDHAYISIYLIENNIAPKVIAMDVNSGPLERAIDNIARYGYLNEIQTRLSDGLARIEPKEADTILIAGMGGALMVKILSQGAKVIEQCKELVLQPQSEQYLVRKYLHKIGFHIVMEQMLIDDDKFYVIIKAIRNIEKLDCIKETYDKKTYDKEISDKKNLDKETLDKEICDKKTYNEERYDKEIFYLYGKLLLLRRDSILQQYLQNEIRIRMQVVKKLESNLTDKAKVRLQEVKQEIEYISEALSYY